MSRSNGATAAAPELDHVTYALEVLKGATHQAGLGHMSWIDAEQRIARSGPIGTGSLPAHLAEIHRDSAGIACRAALLCTHPAVKGADPDHGLHLRLRLQAVAAEAARIEHELRTIGRLIA